MCSSRKTIVLCDASLEIERARRGRRSRGRGKKTKTKTTSRSRQVETPHVPRSPRTPAVRGAPPRSCAAAASSNSRTSSPTAGPCPPAWCPRRWARRPRRHRRRRPRAACTRRSGAGAARRARPGADAGASVTKRRNARCSSGPYAHSTSVSARMERRRGAVPVVERHALRQELRGRAWPSPHRTRSSSDAEKTPSAAGWQTPRKPPRNALELPGDAAPTVASVTAAVLAQVGGVHGDGGAARPAELKRVVPGEREREAQIGDGGAVHGDAAPLSTRARRAPGARRCAAPPRPGAPATGRARGPRWRRRPEARARRRRRRRSKTRGSTRYPVDASPAALPTTRPSRRNRSRRFRPPGLLGAAAVAEVMPQERFSSWAPGTSRRDDRRLVFRVLLATQVGRVGIAPGAERARGELAERSV